MVRNKTQHLLDGLRHLPKRKPTARSLENVIWGTVPTTWDCTSSILELLRDQLVDLLNRFLALGTLSTNSSFHSVARREREASFHFGREELAGERDGEPQEHMPQENHLSISLQPRVFFLTGP